MLFPKENPNRANRRRNRAAAAYRAAVSARASAAADRRPGPQQRGVENPDPVRRGSRAGGRVRLSLLSAQSGPDRAGRDTRYRLSSEISKMNETSTVTTQTSRRSIDKLEKDLQAPARRPRS